MDLKRVRNVTLAASAVLASGCVTNPSQSVNEIGNQFRETFASDDPCSNNARNIGIAAGSVVGAILGKSLGDGKTGTMVAGTVIGGLIGGVIGADMDRKRCELSKVAKQYDLDLTFSEITASGEVATPSSTNNGQSSPTQIVGNTVTVRDKGGAAGHFESGSDQLTPKAREYFNAIAAQYSEKAILADQTDPKRREELSKQVAQRRLFLIGHTDDTGASQLNANLSESRAKAVAGYLKKQGIPEGTLYFQGAGETLPIADNRTDAGRASNRRVEIVEIADESSFKRYLEARQPNHQFYRPTEVVVAATGTSAGNDKLIGQAGSSTTTRTTPGEKETTKNPKTSRKTPTPVKPKDNAPTLAKAPIFDFGGSPYQAQNAALKVSPLVSKTAGFSLISKAYANDNDTVILADCTRDRPRAAGAVKSLRDGTTYRTSEHMPQLYGKTWASQVNGNLVVINKLTVLRDGGTPANLPELKVYAQYKNGISKKPTLSEEPRVNSYLVEQGVLYRMFSAGDTGLKCVDVLFGTDGAKTAQGGKLIYTAGANDLVADFKPQIQ